MFTANNIYLRSKIKSTGVPHFLEATKYSIDYVDHETTPSYLLMSLCLTILAKWPVAEIGSPQMLALAIECHTVILRLWDTVKVP